MVSEYTVISRMPLLKKEQVYHFFWEGGGAIFPWSTFIKAIISIHMYIVRSSICHPSKYKTSKFFFLDFQVFLSRLPKLTPWKSRLPKFES